VSEKLEQIAKAMAQYEEQEQENLIKNNGETKPRAVCAAVVASAGRGGMGMGWGQWGKNGWERDLHDVNHMYVFLLTRTLDSTSLACSESVFSMELRDVRKL
jgi:hypothetical protein